MVAFVVSQLMKVLLCDLIPQRFDLRLRGIVGFVTIHVQTAGIIKLRVLRVQAFCKQTIDLLDATSCVPSSFITL